MILRLKEKVMELECGCAQEEGQTAADFSYRVNQSPTEEQHEVYI